ncbi:MAG: hypothetical protein KGM98_12970 [Bacteroidota bacterium]|nr:hypothetical protein [Bacteroidota bacterium]
MTLQIYFSQAKFNAKGDVGQSRLSRNAHLPGISGGMGNLACKLADPLGYPGDYGK